MTPAATTNGAVEGTIERVTYHDADNGFAVLQLDVRGRRDPVTVVGYLACAAAGEFVEASGRWVGDWCDTSYATGHMLHGARCGVEYVFIGLGMAGNLCLPDGRRDCAASGARRTPGFWRSSCSRLRELQCGTCWLVPSMGGGSAAQAAGPSSYPHVHRLV